MDGQGAEGLSAVLIEFSEKLQALQPQVMDVAAQQVQSRKKNTFPVIPPKVLNTLAMMLPESMRAMRRA